jgi:hypothetical protein
MSTRAGTTRAAVTASLRPVLLTAVVLLAAGCGGAGETPSPQSPPPTIPTGAPPSNRPVPATPDPLVSTPPAGATALPPERVDAGALPAGLPTLVWTRGDETVGVYGRGGGCTDARLEVVEQDTERVVLRVVQFSTGPGPCTRELVYPPLEVTLDAPLGRRPVVLTGQVA